MEELFPFQKSLDAMYIIQVLC